MQGTGYAGAGVAIEDELVAGDTGKESRDFVLEHFG
jgi:hypothetical protein